MTAWSTHANSTESCTSLFSLAISECCNLQVANHINDNNQNHDNNRWSCEVGRSPISCTSNHINVKVLPLFFPKNIQKWNEFLQLKWTSNEICQQW